MTSRLIRGCSLALLLALLPACSSDGATPADRGLARDAGADRGGAAGDLAGDSAADLTRDALPADRSADLPACNLAGVYSSSNAGCNACAEAKCCPELNACFTAPACNDDYVNCTLACALPPEPDGGVPACLALCAAEHPAGKALYDVALGCAESRCATACE